MQFVNVGSYHCEYCKKDILTRVYTDNPERVLEYKDEALKAAKNFHWYDNHYNCALCGKWIPSGERELIVESEFTSDIHHDYNFTERTGLLRLHRKCAEELKGR